MKTLTDYDGLAGNMIVRAIYQEDQKQRPAQGWLLWRQADRGLPIEPVITQRARHHKVSSLDKLCQELTELPGNKHRVKIEMKTSEGIIRGEIVFEREDNL